MAGRKLGGKKKRVTKLHVCVFWNITMQNNPDISCSNIGEVSCTIAYLFSGLSI